MRSRRSARDNAGSEHLPVGDVEASVVWGTRTGLPRPSRSMETAATSGRPRKIRATFSLSHELFEEVRDAAFHLSGPPLRLTMASLAETALRRELNRIKSLHNLGRNFPRRIAELRAGRPLGS